MQAGLPVWVPTAAMTPPVAFSPKSLFYESLCHRVQAAWDRGRPAELAGVLARTSKGLWLYREPPLVSVLTIQLIGVDVLLSHPQVEIAEPPHLWRMLLQLLTVMPEQHLLALVTPVAIGSQTGHLLALLAVSDTVAFYWGRG